MKYHNHNLKITTLSPLHIGNGNSLSKLTELKRKYRVTKEAKLLAVDIAKNLRELNTQKECPNGGVIKLHINANEGATSGTVDEEYINCQYNDAVLNGKVKVYVKLNEYGDELKYAKVDFVNDFTLQNKTLDQKIVYYRGSKVEFSNFTEDGFDEKSTVKLEVNGKKYGSENALWHYSNDGYGELTAYQKSGKIYINNATEYVTYDTSYDMSKTPLELSFSGSEVYKGEAHYITKGNGKLILKVIDTNLIEISIDKDGDGIIDKKDTYKL